MKARGGGVRVASAQIALGQGAGTNGQASLGGFHRGTPNFTLRVGWVGVCKTGMRSATHLPALRLFAPAFSPERRRWIDRLRSRDVQRRVVGVGLRRADDAIDAPFRRRESRFA